MLPIQFSPRIYDVIELNSSALSIIMELATDDEVVNNIIDDGNNYHILKRLSELTKTNPQHSTCGLDDEILISFSNAVKSLLTPAVKQVRFDHILHSDEKTPKKDFYIFVVRDAYKDKNDIVFGVWALAVDSAEMVMLDWISKDDLLNIENKTAQDYFNFKSSYLCCIKHLN